MSTLKIFGKDTSVLSVSLIDIISCFTDYKKLIYELHFIEGVSSDSNYNQLEFEQKINSSSGIKYTFEVTINKLFRVTPS